MDNFAIGVCPVRNQVVIIEDILNIDGNDPCHVRSEQLDWLAVPYPGIKFEDIVAIDGSIHVGYFNWAVIRVGLAIISDGGRAAISDSATSGETLPLFTEPVVDNQIGAPFPGTCVGLSSGCTEFLDSRQASRIVDQGIAM